MQMNICRTGKECIFHSNIKIDEKSEITDDIESSVA